MARPLTIAAATVVAAALAASPRPLGLATAPNASVGASSPVLAPARLVPVPSGATVPLVPPGGQATSRRAPAGTPGAPASCLPRGEHADPRPRGAPSPYRCPVPGRPVRLFDGPATRYSAGHRGLDLAAAPGEVVRAPAAGVVRFAGTVAGRGVVTIDHGGGWATSLEPVTAAVPVGTRVAPGDPVGTLATAPVHCSPRACLHVGVRLGPSGDGYVDPSRLLRAVRVVLLPLG